jgi:hypothetical protein
MKKALICPNEPLNLINQKTGYRVAQVETAESIFPVADPLYWLDCSDEVVADFWYFDLDDATIKEVPVPAPRLSAPIGNAPNVLA